MKIVLVALAAAVMLLSSSTFGATYFAEISATGRVKRTVVIPDAQAASGETWTGQLLGGSWKQTFIDGSQRGSYANQGYRYDATSNTFKPYLTAIIGDSIIWNMRQFGVHSSLPAPFPSMQNLGVDGDRTDQILARLGSIASNVTDVILEGGTNDFFQGADSAIIPNYTSILNSLTPTRRVFIVGIPPVDEPAMDQSRLPFLNNSKITAKNAQIATLCAGYTNCFMTTVRSMSMTGKASDGVHPVAATYSEIAARILDAL